jgi:hypothetical protein
MSKKGKEIFLGRNGRVYGPYASAEFEEMTASGRIDQFHWIWDEPGAKWKPLDPPPAPLSRGDAPIVHASTAAASGLEVICYDGRSLLSGRLESATETGCVIFSENGGDGPAFPGDATVGINLLDAGAGRSISVPGRLIKVAFEEGRWVYRFRWESSPLEALAAG